jgi:hypothetical protein
VRFEEVEFSNEISRNPADSRNNSATSNEATVTTAVRAECSKTVHAAQLRPAVLLSRAIVTTPMNNRSESLYFSFLPPAAELFGRAERQSPGIPLSAHGAL